MSMPSSRPKSGIPVMSGKAQGSRQGASSSGVSSSLKTGIPTRAKTSDSPKLVPSAATITSTSKEEDVLRKQVAKLEEDVKTKDLTINDLNDKLVVRMREYQILSDDKEAVMDKISMSNQENPGEMEKLKKLLNDRDISIQDLERNKLETERKFQVEFDMLKNQYEIEILTLQERLEDAHGERVGELQTSLQNEKMVSGKLRDELKGVRHEEKSAEVNTLNKELMSTKLRYDDMIHTLNEELEKERGRVEGGGKQGNDTDQDTARINSQDEDYKTNEDIEKEIENLKKSHKEELDTLKYVLQEKDVEITDLKQRVDQTAEDDPTTAEGGKRYSHEEVVMMLEELRQELTRESEQNIAMANELWRRKFEQDQEKVNETNRKTRNTNEEVTSDDDSNQEDGPQGEANDAKKMVEEISDLKQQLQEATELQGEQAELLEIQDKEIDELKESNKEYDERYNVLFKEMETKWQDEFSESDIIEKIKSHYEMEVERLHGDLEEIQNENSNLKTELDLMTSDFDGGHEGRGRTSGTVRRNSVNARLDLKVEVEDYKVQLAVLERDLQHALNQNERLKLENGIRGTTGDGQTAQQIDSLSNKIAEFEEQRQKLFEERDEIRMKFENFKKEKKRIEKDMKSLNEAKRKIEEEFKIKCEEVILSEKQHKNEVGRFKEEISRLKTDLDGVRNGQDSVEVEVVSMEEKLKESGIRESGLGKAVEELKRKEMELVRELEDVKSERLQLETQVNKLVPVAEEYNRLKAEFDEMESNGKEIQTREIEKSKERLMELETTLNRNNLEFEKLNVKYEKLLKENEARDSKIDELETTLSRRNKEYKELETNYDEVHKEKEMRNSGIGEMDTVLRQKKVDYDELKVKYQKLSRENETNASRIGDMETKLSQRKVEFKDLKANYEELSSENKTKNSRIAEVEIALSRSREEYEKLKVTCDELYKDNETKTSRIAELETTARQREVEFDKLCSENESKSSTIGEMKTTLNKNKKEYEKLRANCDKLNRDNETKTVGSDQLQTTLDQTEAEFEKLNATYEKVLRENEAKASRISDLEKEANHSRKQVMAFEKKVASQEREKKSLEEKNRSLGKLIEEKGQEISHLKEKCESHDLTQNELGAKLGTLRDGQETIAVYEQRNKELTSLVERSNRERDGLLEKQAELMEENSELRIDRDRLEDEKGTVEDTKDNENVEHERKLGVVERKLKEKDRVLNETKKQSRQLKETLKETEERCTELEEEIEKAKEEKHKESKKLKGMLDNAKKSYMEKEKGLREELVEQGNNFEQELLAVKENMKQAGQIEVAEMTRELQEKLELRYNREEKGTREELSRLSEGNHALKIRVDDLAIEVSKEKQEKYKLEKLKDQFRFQVQNLQQGIEDEREKLSQIQSEQLEASKTMGEDKETVVAALNEYESKNTKLISDIERASGILKKTREKYGKLKEKYVILSRKYTKLNGEKLNKSDVQVGPDVTIDFSLVMEDLQQSKEETEEANTKLREEMDRLREEMGRNHYQVKAVRKANVVLMKQSRCLYHESEANKRVDEEKTRALEKYQELNGRLKQEKDILEREQEILESRVEHLEVETSKVKEQCEGYFMSKNKSKIELEEKTRECAMHSHQLDKLKEENGFLYEQGKKLQSELNDFNKQSMSRRITNYDENRNVRPMVDFDGGVSRPNKRVNEMVQSKTTTPDYGTGLFSAGSNLSESIGSPSFEEARHSTPVLYNNVKTEDEKMFEKLDKNGPRSIRYTTTRSPNKDTNLQLSKNLMNNEFATEKYLGSTYWETLAFLKKK